MREREWKVWLFTEEIFSAAVCSLPFLSVEASSLSTGSVGQEGWVRVRAVVWWTIPYENVGERKGEKYKNKI